MKRIIEILMVACLFPILASGEPESIIEPNKVLSGYEVMTTCASCPRWKQGKELVLRDSQGKTVKSWWLGRQEKNRKAISHDDSRVEYTLERFKSAGVSVDHQVFSYDEINQSVYLPLNSGGNSGLASAALLQTRSASMVDFTDFEYPYDDPQPLQAQEGSFKYGVMVLGANGEVLWSLDKLENTSYALGTSWISQEASVVGLLHFESGIFYVQFYDTSGKLTYRLPPASFTEHTEKYAIKSPRALTRSGEHFVLAVSYNVTRKSRVKSTGKIKVRTKRKRGTFVLDTKNGGVGYFDQELNLKEAIARFVAKPTATPGPTPPIPQIWPKLMALPSGFENKFNAWWTGDKKAGHFLQMDPYCGEGLSNFVRGDFNGDGQEDEIGWYLGPRQPGVMPALYFGSRFSVGTENEKFTLIEEREPVHWKLNEVTGKKYHFLGQALKLVKKGKQTSAWEEHDLKLKYDAVQVYNCESSAFILYWDGSPYDELPNLSRWGKGKFKKYWTAD